MHRKPAASLSRLASQRHGMTITVAAGMTSFATTCTVGSCCSIGGAIVPLEVSCCCALTTTCTSGCAGGSGSRAQAVAIVVLSVVVGLTLAALLAVTLAAYGGGAAIINAVSKVQLCLTMVGDNVGSAAAF
jgi:hypothetical protein